MPSSTNLRKRSPYAKETVLPHNKKGSASDEQKQLACVRFLQRAWRRKLAALCTKRIVQRFVKTGPTSFGVQRMSFEQLVVFLREKPVIEATKACLQRIHRLCAHRHGSPSSALSPENVNVRVFLAGFMIAYRPTHVFESMGTLEQKLSDSTLPLIAQFEKICNAFTSNADAFDDIPPALTENFQTLLFEFLKAFKAWKVPDEAKLTCRIRHALIALYQAEEHLPPDEPEDSKLKQEFKTQIGRLRSKLQQIAGENALKAFDEERLRGATGSNYGGGPPDNHSGGGAYAALPGRMTNEQLAHELLLDPTFQLDESGGCSVENPVFHRIRESFHQAFWDSLVDDLKLAEPCYVRVLRVLCEIRDGIHDLAGSRGNLDDVMDMDHIKYQTDHRLFTWNSCRQLVAAIVSIIQRVQSPKRDNETKAKWELIAKSMDEEPGPRVFCKALEFLLDRVNAMRIDAANARLRLIAPVVTDHGVDYERGKFQDKLNDGTLTLERTTAWIQHTVEREVKEEKSITLDGLLSGSAAAFVHTHSTAMLALVTGPLHIKPELCPETLLFDVYRLSLLQIEFREQAKAASLLVTATHWTKGALDMVRAVHEAPSTLEALEPIFKNVPGAAEALRECAEPTSAVHRLIAQRLRALWGKLMRDGSKAFTKGDCALVRTAKPLLPAIEKSAAKLLALANLNRTVHLPTYNKLIREASLALRV